MHNHDLNRLSNDPFQTLEQELGFPFFTSLQAVVRLRVQSLDDTRSSRYLGCLAEGLQNKHSWISDDWVIIFFQRMLVDRFERLWNMDESPDDSCAAVSGIVMDDLLTALGILEREHHPRMGRSDLLALDRVFRGTQSFAEIAEEYLS